MSVLDSYVHTLRVFLPRDQREDIIRELTEDINAQMADKALDLGRPLTIDEETAIVGQYGHPLLMAARYRPQRHLVGPVIFPYYLLVLKVVIGLVIAGHVISAVLLRVGGAPWSEVGMVGEHLLQTMLAVGGWFTLLAAVVDRSLIRNRTLEKWDPKRFLPPVAHAERAVRHAGRMVERHGPPMWSGSRMTRGRASSFGGILVGAVLSAWWLVSLKYPVLMLGTSLLTWGPVVTRAFPFLLIMQLLVLAEHFVRVARPNHRRFFEVTRVVWFVGFPIFLYFLTTVDHQWVMWSGAPETHAQLNTLIVIAGRTLSLVDIVNYTMSAILLFVAMAGIINLANSIQRRLSGRGTRIALT